MRAPISVILPTLNAAPYMAGSLACLFDGLDRGVIRELIISDATDPDTPAGQAMREIAAGIGAKFLHGPAGRGGQLRRGADAANGGWMLFLHADTHLPTDWVDLVVPLLADPERAHAFRLSFRDGGWQGAIVAGGANLRSRLFGLPYGDQGLLISRALYDAVGGFRDMALMEDVAIARALRGRIRLIAGAPVATSAARFRARGWVRGVLRNLWTLARYATGHDPVDLARTYEKR